jgi:hypothetical protein
LIFLGDPLTLNQGVQLQVLVRPPVPLAFDLESFRNRVVWPPDDGHGVLGGLIKKVTIRNEFMRDGKSFDQVRSKSSS